MAETKASYDNFSHTEVHTEHDDTIKRRGSLADPNLMSEAYDGEIREHEQTMWQAFKAQPWACLFAIGMCFTIVMECYDMVLNGNFVALRPFQERYGVFVGYKDGVAQYAIETKWQSALFQSGQCGALIGVLIAGPITNRLGYRWTTIGGLLMMNATIFICFFADSLMVLTIGQLFEGIPWGIFIANSPAYASEIAPLALRGAITATLQLAWSVGGIIVAGVTFAYNQRNDEWAWRVRKWLARKGRKAEALKSLERLGDGNSQHTHQAFAVIERTIEIEESHGTKASFFDLFKGTDLRRTLIICGAYASQNFAGNLIANQAVFFFEQAGISHDKAFELNLINSCLAVAANIGALGLTRWFGRRTIYLWGTAANVVFLMLLGVVASIHQSSATNYTQAILGIFISFVYAGAMGPTTYTIIAETSSLKLRALSTGIGRAAYYICEIPMIYLASQLLNTTGWNMAGKCGYVWGGTACVCWIIGYFFLPEMKDRSYRELDILFNREVPARKFKKTLIDVKDNE